MENLVNKIANTFTIIVGTFTACAIGFTIYTVTIVIQLKNKCEKTWRSQRNFVYLDINKERKFKQKPNKKLNYELPKRINNI